MVITNISEAKATLSRLIEQVLNGQEVIIGKAGKPVAKLVPYTQDTSPRQLGVGHSDRLDLESSICVGRRLGCSRRIRAILGRIRVVRIRVLQSA